MASCASDAKLYVRSTSGASLPTTVHTGGGSSMYCSEASEVSTSPVLEEIMREVAVHCGVSNCVLVLRQSNQLTVKRQWSKDGTCIPEIFQLNSVDELHLFHHHIDRRLPIIIADAKQHKTLMHDPLVKSSPNLRFYAEAPLASNDGTFFGTLCIFDKAAKADFTLDDAEYLCEKAELVARLAEVDLRD
eukprot:TRINITY_DN33157_c0_g1_i1.p1 TRINITY_DN33157_c0_g1~~TRINITY_DN33157_c0_g1_i1.p1  ORF type:complete len:208 (-),score=33.94 TRINITY_DN33157_c0_g1_i1:131-697(-)